MPVAKLKFIKRCIEFQERDSIGDVPPNTRGIYALLKRKKRHGEERYDVVYMGMAGGPQSGIRGRLKSHAKSKTKGQLWSHFSVFEVHDNTTPEEVKELEGLFRHIYRKDTRANRLNRQRSFKRFKDVRVGGFDEWDVVR